MIYSIDQMRCKGGCCTGCVMETSTSQDVCLSCYRADCPALDIYHEGTCEFCKWTSRFDKSGRVILNQKGQQMVDPEALPAIRERIREAVRKQNITYAALGRKAGVSENYPNRLVNHNTCKIEFRKVACLYKALGLPVSEILVWKEV